MTANPFTASNGGIVSVLRGGRATVTDNNPEQHEDGLTVTKRTSYLSLNQVDALREFFQRERDEELGRWRDPDDPQFVVYPARQMGSLGKPAALLMNETDTMRSVHGRADSTLPGPVQRYFDAHPKPKPWHYAQPGEVWALTADGEESGWLARETIEGMRFISTGVGTLELDHPSISDGWRIYPEDD